MAHIFKHPTHDSKGIVVFTHKEMGWFFEIKKSLISKILKKSSGHNSSAALKDVIESKKIRELYQQIQKNYFIGVHYGWDPEKIRKFYNCDFHLIQNHSITKNSSKILQIPLGSTNFTPSIFQKTNQKKTGMLLV